MADLLIPNIEDTLLNRLKQRALEHGASAEFEARAILTAALDPLAPDRWGVVDALREKLATSGRNFADSTDLIREDRAR